MPSPDIKAIYANHQSQIDAVLDPNVSQLLSMLNSETDSKTLEAIRTDLEGEITHILNPKYSSYTPETLQALCHHVSSQPTEILVYDTRQPLDSDLFAVIHMKAKHARDKQKTFIILPIDRFDAIMETGLQLPDVDKLSFLHHGEYAFFYQEKLSAYVGLMPDLKQIVIRACAVTPDAPVAGLEPQRISISKVKKFPLPYTERATLQGPGMLYIQQKNEGKNIYTKASWMTVDAKGKKIMHEICDMPDLPEIPDGPIKNDEIIDALNHIQGMPRVAYSGAYIEAASERFFSKTTPPTATDIERAKASVHRARTDKFYVSDATVPLPNDSLLVKLWNNLTPEQRQQVSLKSYDNAWQSREGRVRPRRKIQGSRPKAWEISAKPTPVSSSPASAAEETNNTQAAEAPEPKKSNRF